MIKLIFLVILFFDLSFEDYFIVKSAIFQNILIFTDDLLIIM